MTNSFAERVALRINATGVRELSDEENSNVVEMRYNRRGRSYFLSDRTMLVVPVSGEAAGLGNGKSTILFPLTTVEELDSHLVAIRNGGRSRQAVVEAYLDFRFARANRQYSTSSTIGAYSRTRLPRGGRMPLGRVQA